MPGCSARPAIWFEDVGYVVEFDCPGTGLVSRTSGGTDLFTVDGEFVNTAGPVLKAHGLTGWEHHPYSDVMALRQRFAFCSLNLSSGYHNWHRPTEYAVLEEVEAAVDAGEALISALGCQDYPFGCAQTTCCRISPWAQSTSGPLPDPH